MNKDNSLYHIDLDKIQDHSPSKKQHSRKSQSQGAELSLETLQILLSSSPDSEQQQTDDELFTVELERQKYFDLVRSTLQQKHQLLKRVKMLKHAARGADWLNRNISVFQSKFPWELVSLIESMASNHSEQVVIKSSAADISVVEPAFQERVVGEIQGLEIFRMNIRHLITNNLESPLTRLTPGVLNQVTDDDLINWAEWCESLEQRFIQLENILQAGQRFFTQTNFRLMEQLPLSPKSRSALQKINQRLFENAGFS